MADEKQQDDYIEIKIPQEEQQPAVKPAPEPSVESKPEPSEKKEPVKKTVNKPITPKKKAAKKKTSKKAAKPVPVKTAKKKAAKKKQQNSSSWLWIVLLFIGLVVIAAVIYLSLQSTPTQEEVSEEDYAVALVNDEAVYASELNQIYDELPDQVKVQTSKEDVLNQLIEQRLLLQEADKQGIVVTQEELAKYNADLMAFFGITEEQLGEILLQQGITKEEFDDSNREQIIVTKLINQTIIAKLVITEEEVKARYDMDIELYSVPEQAIVRHILVGIEENVTDEELMQKTQGVEDMIADDFSNYCDLVANYTGDPASIPTCGEYAVAQDGQFVKPFEDGAYAIDVNETTIVNSTFGYHILWKVDHVEAGTLPLEQVAEDVRAALSQEKTSLEVRLYLDELRDQATVEKYPVDGSVPVTNVAVDQEEEAEAEEQMKVEVEKTQPVRQGDFGDCLADANAVLYGNDWAPDVQEQIDLLGEAFEQIEYVDCDAVDCENISVYPTWVIDGDTVQGKQSINALSQKTGCNV